MTEFRASRQSPDRSGTTPPREAAYSGRLSRMTGYLPGPVRRPLVEAGGMTSMLGAIVWSAVRHPRGYWRAVIDEMYATTKRAWLPITLAIAGFQGFITILVILFFNMLGAAQYYGPLLFIENVRMFNMWVNAVVVAGVVGAALTTDIGARKVREELDAMEVMGIDPMRELAVPKVLSLTFILVLLTMPSLVITFVSMQIGALWVAHLPANAFYQNLFDNMWTIDVIALVLNSFLTGLLIGGFCCYKGFTAAGGAIGLGRAVNQAVVVSFMGVFVFQMAYQALYLGLFPQLGVFR